MKRQIKERQYKFEEFKSQLSNDDNLILHGYFEDLDRHVILNREDSLRLKTDFETAIMYYDSIGVSLEEALNRLDVRNLGGFYARPPVVWFRLDDAAKLYPLSMKHGQMAVFRISAYLKEDVVPEILQMALTFTIKRFPSFATTVKKGFFWHYLDTSKKRYSVEKEKETPCKPMNVSGSGSQSFRVLYYGKRISAEFFHILTDGSGGLVFLKTLLAEYLRLLGKYDRASDAKALEADAEVSETKTEAKASDPMMYDILDINQTPPASEMVSSLPNSDEEGKWSGFVDKPALQLSGKLSKLRLCQILHFKLDAPKLKEVAHREGCTVTAYLLSQLFIAGRHATDEYTGEINIQVPVNLRKYYPSDSMRNFFMCCGIRISVEDIDIGENLIKEVSDQLKEKASRKAMSEMMDITQKLVKAVKYIPLSIKSPVARIAYGFLGDRVFSNTFSNLGIVNMPKKMGEHIEAMDFILGTSVTNRACCTLVTFEDTATLTVAKLTEDPSFEEKLAELLNKEELLKDVEGSQLYKVRGVVDEG